MATTLLISETFIRDNTVFNKNVDIQDIVNNVGVAQDMFLEPILGTTFYHHIEAAYSAQTLTADEVTLMTYVKPMLAWRAAEMSLPFLTFNIKNKGPQTQGGDNSASVDSSILFYLKKEIINRAEWYAARLEKYLFLNQSLFTLYVTQGNVDLQPDRDSGYDSGFATYGNGCGYSGPRCNGFNGFWNSNGY